MTDMTWHADATTLASYLDGGLTEAYACSVEAHLLACERCRLALAMTSTDRDSARPQHIRRTSRCTSAPGPGCSTRSTVPRATPS